MPTTTIAELTESAAQLSAQDFDRFLANVYTRRAQKHAPSLSTEEQSLLGKIYQKLPQGILERFESLREKCLAETLAAAEYSEYLGIIELMESQNAARLENLIHLAQIQGIAPKKLMDQLGIFPLHAL